MARALNLRFVEQPKIQNMKLAFLLGSGFSRPALFPSTEDITTRILSGIGVMRHTDSNYYFGNPLFDQPDEYVPKMVSFVAWLKKEIDSYYSYHPSRHTTYEDIFYVASQILDSESGNFDNPAIAPLVALLKKTEDILTGTPYNSKGRWSVIDLTAEVTKFIRDVVRHMLAVQPSRTDVFELLTNACSDNTTDQVNIFTLNHDTLIEQILQTSSITFIDGFDEPKDHLRLWNPDLYEINNQAKVLLYKLHGSVNWVRFEDSPTLTLGIPLKDFWETAPREYISNSSPEILIGTFNKILSYSGPIYIDLQCLFNKSLRSTTRIVVSGYSFNDKAVNTHLIYWLNSNTNNKLLIIHPDFDSLKSCARVAIRNKLDKWLADGQLSQISKKIEDTAWNDVKMFL